MYAPTALALDVLSTAVSAAEGGVQALAAALDALDAPIYVTDASGVVVYFNPACVGFSGRTPSVGKDRWCVTWKLYTDRGEPLPHDACPMAVAIKEARTVRGLTAIAERPDGTRVHFLPLPTPILGADGRLVGAVNMLIDITELRQAPELRSQARHARMLARSITDRMAVDNLFRMADELDTRAAMLETGSVYLVPS